jgi:hypothetical protein
VAIAAGGGGDKTFICLADEICHASRPRSPRAPNALLCVQNK